MEDKELKQLLQMLINVIARGSFPEDRVRKIVCSARSSEKHLEAYNLCDGNNKLIDIAEQVELDRGNLSKVMARWVDAGVVFEVGKGNQVKFLHLYPLAPVPKTSK